ncbi:MAG: type II secretion system F family protein [Dehalococcoidia bacterium]
MQFSYVAYTIQEGVIKGRLDARNEEEARAEVIQQGYTPLRVTPTRKLPGLEEIFPSLYRLKTGELVRFARQMATMLGSGSGLMRTLEMLQSETRNRIMRRTLGTIRENLDEGGSLSAALAEHPKYFSPLFISVVEVGEYTGRLGPALEQMADILEKEHEARQKAMQTMMYPMAIIGLSMVTLFVLMTVALPPLLSVFDKMDAEIPLMTRMALGGSNMIKDNILLIALGVVALVVVYRLLRRFPRVSFWLDGARARAPIVGSLTVIGELARFSSTVAMLLGAGVSLSTAMQLGLSGCKNQVIRRAFIDAEESLMSGRGVAEALKRHPILPVMFVQLVTIGEESNSLQRTMEDAANAYQKQHEARLNAILGMLEPFSTVVVGGIVGFIAMSMFVPIYSGMNAIK